MKIKTVLTVCVLIAVFAFSACGGSPEADSAPASDSSKAEPQAQTAEKSETVSVRSGEEKPPWPEEVASLRPVPGKYNLVGMTQNGETVATQDLAAIGKLGMEMYLMLNEDGTGEISLYGESNEMTWDEKGITAGEETVPYEWDGKNLTLADGDTSLTFSTRTVQELIDAGEGVEGTMSFFDEEDGSAGAKAAVTITGADWVRDHEDREVLVVWFNVTNISAEDIYASKDAYTVAVQDGTELGYGYIDEEVVPETANVYNRIRPGETLHCANVFKAEKEGGPIEYRITTAYGDTEILKIELDPANLQGAPEDAG